MEKWKVLLIGGSSAVGKSYLARQLSDELHIPLTEVDDIRISLQQVLNRTSHPDLYFFLNKPYPEILKENSIDELVKRLLKVGEEIWPALDTLIEKHIVCNEPVIFEGDAIIPNLLAKKSQENIKSIFIWDSRDNLLERSKARARHSGSKEELEAKQAEFSASFGEGLKKQAIENNFEVLEATPLETLLQRALNKLR